MQDNFRFDKGDLVVDVEFPAAKFHIIGRLFDVDSGMYYYRVIDLSSNNTEVLFASSVDSRHFVKVG